MFFTFRNAFSYQQGFFANQLAIFDALHGFGIPIQKLQQLLRSNHSLVVNIFMNYNRIISNFIKKKFKQTNDRDKIIEYQQE